MGFIFTDRYSRVRTIFGIFNYLSREINCYLFRCQARGQRTYIIVLLEKVRLRVKRFIRAELRTVLYNWLGFAIRDSAIVYRNLHAHDLRGYLLCIF